MIFQNIFTVSLVLVSLLIQGHTSFDAIRMAGVKPDLLFILVIYVSYSFGSFYGMTTGFFGGIFHDAISNAPLGLLTFPKMVLGYIVGMFGRSVFQANAVTVVLLVFSATLLKGIITLFLSYIFHQASVDSIISIIIPESFYNAVIAPLLFILLDKIYEKELEREGHK